MKDYQKAMDMLELADKIPNVDKNVVAENRREVISEMKNFMRSWKFPIVLIMYYIIVLDIYTTFFDN